MKIEKKITTENDSNLLLNLKTLLNTCNMWHLAFMCLRSNSHLLILSPQHDPVEKKSTTAEKTLFQRAPQWT